MRATYSAEDDKLRIYPEGERVDSILDEAEYAAFKKAGYKWAAKQECFVAYWSCSAEDWAYRLIDSGEEIDDEDYSATERSADRAERFGTYREKRAVEAHEAADRAEGAGSLGYQSEQLAAVAQRRADRATARAVNRWDTATYWQERTRGVIAHALHRAKPEVRRSRIARLESEHRKALSELDEYRAAYSGWLAVPDRDGADEPIVEDAPEDQRKPAWLLAYCLANTMGAYWSKYKHPRLPDSREGSLYQLLTDRAYPITPREASELYLAAHTSPDDYNSRRNRLLRHLSNRLAYERAMLAEEGGAATDVDMVAGGWLASGGNRYQIQRVWKSPATKRVSSVSITNPKTGKLQRIDLERFGENVYQSPTPEELDAFNASKKAEKDAREPVPTINPTREDAERLQEILNRQARAEFDAKPAYNKHTPPQTVEVREITQARFSDWRRCEYVLIRELTDGERTVKIRLHRSPMYRFNDAENVLVLTDKPQKPLGLDWEALEARLIPTQETATA